MADVKKIEIQQNLPWVKDKEENQNQKKKVVKRANNLDGKSWLRNSISVWSDIKKTAEEEALGHPAIFPIQLVTRSCQ